MPMTTPTMASAERAGWERIDSIARLVASPSAPDIDTVRVDAAIASYSALIAAITSRRTARRAGYQPATNPLSADAARLPATVDG